MNLLILGAGQYGSVAYEIALSMACYQKIDFLDDMNPVAIGRLSEYGQFADEYDCAFVAIGNPASRLIYIENLVKCGFHVVNLISPYAYVAKSAIWGKGCIAESMSVVNPNTEIGDGCLICAGAVINHNAIVGDGCQIDCNATVASNAIVPSQTKLCCGTVWTSSQNQITK